MARLILATEEGERPVELRPINSLGRHPNNTIQVLDKIVSKDPENEYAKMFLNAHYIEMVEVFRRAQDKTPLRTLMVIDPAHAQVYRNIIEK